MSFKSSLNSPSTKISIYFNISDVYSHLALLDILESNNSSKVYPVQHHISLLGNIAFTFLINGNKDF